MVDKSYQDEEELRRLYWEEKMSQPQLAEKFDVARTTIQYWMDKHEIEKRSDKEGGKMVLKKLNQSLSMDNEGHEQLKGAGESVYHHRLLSLLKYDVDEIEGKIVHHRNHIPWDNRLENLELMGRGEHMEHHHAVRRGEKEPDIV
jgi:DNA-binding XRE family transcriptional regulator